MTVSVAQLSVISSTDSVSSSTDTVSSSTDTVSSLTNSVGRPTDSVSGYRTTVLVAVKIVDCVIDS